MPYSLSMRDVFPFGRHGGLQTQRGVPKPRAAPDASVAVPPPKGAKPDKPGPDARTRELQERYGLSRPMLELVKRYDVRSINGDDLARLGRLLAKEGGYSFRDVHRDHALDDYYAFYSFQSDAGNGNALEFYTERRRFTQESGVYEGTCYFSASEDLQRNVDFLQRLADIHDALQEEKDVKCADATQLDRQYRSLQLDEFVERYRHQPEQTEHWPPEWIRNIRQAMQERGVEVGEADEGSAKEQLARLWQSYQRWEAEHPPEPRVDTWA